MSAVQMTDLAHTCEDGSIRPLVRTTAFGRNVWSCPSRACDFVLGVFDGKVPARDDDADA